ncbi:MAG TPA: hypothetical protein VKD00_06990 [Methyloceanibacter sp.]|nr:hypothetical protein [Methyloceanibacter sp.]
MTTTEETLAQLEMALQDAQDAVANGVTENLGTLESLVTSDDISEEQRADLLDLLDRVAVWKRASNEFLDAVAKIPTSFPKE